MKEMREQKTWIWDSIWIKYLVINKAYPAAVKFISLSKELFVVKGQLHYKNVHVLPSNIYLFPNVKFIMWNAFKT